PVFDVGEQDGFGYYVMQLIHGRGLDTALGRHATGETSGTLAPSAVDAPPAPAPTSLPATSRIGPGEPSSDDRPTANGPTLDVVLAPTPASHRAVARIGVQ